MSQEWAEEFSNQNKRNGVGWQILLVVRMYESRPMRKDTRTSAHHKMMASAFMSGEIVMGESPKQRFIQVCGVSYQKGLEGSRSRWRGMQRKE